MFKTAEMLALGPESRDVASSKKPSFRDASCQPTCVVGVPQLAETAGQRSGHPKPLLAAGRPQLENPQAVPSSQGHQRLSRQAVPHPPKLPAKHGHPAFDGDTLLFGFRDRAAPVLAPFQRPRHARPARRYLKCSAPLSEVRSDGGDQRGIFFLNGVARQRPPLPVSFLQLRDHTLPAHFPAAFYTGGNRQDPEEVAVTPITPEMPVVSLSRLILTIPVLQVDPPKDRFNLTIFAR